MKSGGLYTKLSSMKIQDEIHQTKFNGEMERLTINLMFTNAWVMGFQQKFFKSHQLTMQQYNILRILRGQKGKSITMNDVSCRMIDRMSNTSRIIDKLVEKELVDRKQGTKDRRKVMVSIKAKGMDLLKSLDQPMIDMMNSYSNIEEKDARKLNELLDKLREQ